MVERPTAKTFREPALRALGNLCDLTPEKDVSYKDVCRVVLETEGLTEDQYGIQKGSGRPWLHVWIGWAATRILREEGLLELVPKTRGRWYLTTEGVMAAKALLEKPETTTPVNESGVCFHLQGAADTYNKDRYLRALAIESHGCMGHYSDKDVCWECTLGATCRDQTHFYLAQLAVLLDEQDKINAEMVDVDPQDLEAIDPVGDPDDEPDAAINDPELDHLVTMMEDADPGTLKGSGEMLFVVQNEGVCFVCGEKIPAGVEAYWSTAGLRHKDCTPT